MYIYCVYLNVCNYVSSYDGHRLELIRANNKKEGSPSGGIKMNERKREEKKGECYRKMRGKRKGIERKEKKESRRRRMKT